jgi:hypothetical protein
MYKINKYVYAYLDTNFISLVALIHLLLQLKAKVKLTPVLN